MVVVNLSRSPRKMLCLCNDTRCLRTYVSLWFVQRQTLGLVVLMNGCLLRHMSQWIGRHFRDFLFVETSVSCICFYFPCCFHLDLTFNYSLADDQTPAGAGYQTKSEPVCSIILQQSSIKPNQSRAQYDLRFAIMEDVRCM